MTAMKNKSAIITRFVVTLTRLTNAYAVLAKIPIDFGTGEKLTAAEIHCIEAIGKNDGTPVTELANLFGVTPGAVSQMIGKLESKGYIVKSRNPDHWKKVGLSLTERGRIALNGHEAFHCDMDSDILHEIEMFREKDIEVHLEVMNKVEEQIKRYIARLS